jgi:hypothetical protein
MLAPGDCLISPTTDAPPRQPTAERRTEPPAPAPAAKPEEPEPRSFLMTLLRALGAIHT